MMSGLKIKNWLIQHTTRKGDKEETVDLNLTCHHRR